MSRSSDNSWSPDLVSLHHFASVAFLKILQPKWLHMKMDTDHKDDAMHEDAHDGNDDQDNDG